MDSEQLQKLLQTVKKAENDSHKCASLLVVAKLVKGDQLSNKQRQELFRAIGFAFPMKLVINSQKSGNEKTSDNVMLNLGLSLLSAFASDSELCQAPEFHQVLPYVIKTMNTLQMTCDDDPLVIDCLQIMVVTAMTDNGCQTILKYFALQDLIELFCTNKIPKFNETFWAILCYVAKYDEVAVWKKSKTSMIKLLKCVSKIVKSDQTEYNFFLFKQLSLLLYLCPVHYADLYKDEMWLKPLADSLYEVLCSRIGPEQRNPSLKLCCCLTELFGLMWCYRKENEKVKFLVFLTRLVCVETQMLVHKWIQFDAQSFKENLSDDDVALLLICFTIIEAVCCSISDYDSQTSYSGPFTFESIKQLETSLSETASIVVESLMQKLLENGGESSDLLLSCVKMIGSWLNIQIHATSEVGLRIIAPVISAFKHCIEIESSLTMKALTPAILHYAEHQEARKELLKLDITSILCNQLTDNKVITESNTLAAQCLMALCLESDSNETFISMLPILMERAIQMRETEFVFSFYVSTLSLLIWNKHSQQKTNESLRFFRHIAKLLHDIHLKDGSRIETAKRFSDVWNEVEELWHILMKELIRSCIANENIAKIIKESRLPTKIQSLLLHSNDDSEVASCYRLFNTSVLAVK